MKSQIIKLTPFLLIFGLLIACQPEGERELNEDALASMGMKYKSSYDQAAEEFRDLILDDTTSTDALLGLAETNVILYIFGYTSREETIPEARMALQKARSIDSLSAEIHRLSGVMSFLDWDWENSEASFLQAIQADPQNLSARHWYSLYLSAMGKFDKAMEQSDIIMTMDPEENYLIGRGSLLYFQHRFKELMQITLKAIAKDTTQPWGYDWLGMAYNGLEEHEDALDTYFKAFELSDGTVEVGAGLGHALGMAGESALAKQMADYYTLMAQDHYLPPCQRSFVHIGIGEYEKAIELLEQAYSENSWFLIFIQIEPWYDPIRNDQRVADIIRQMEFPKYKT